MESATSHAFPISNNLYSVALQTPTWSAYIRQFWTTTPYSDNTTIDYHCFLSPHTSDGTSTRNAYNCALSTSTREEIPARTEGAGALYTLTGDNLPARTDALQPPTHQSSYSGFLQPSTTRDVVSAGTALSTHSPRTTYQPKLHEQALLNHPPTSHHTPTSYNQRPPDTLYHLERNDPAPSPHSPRTTDQRLGLHEQTPLNHTPINHLTPASYDHRPPETLYQLERNDAAPSPQSPTSKYQPELLARISRSIENAISNSSFGHRLDRMNRSMEEYIRKCNLELPN